MNPGFTCRCPLCRIEQELLRNIADGVQQECYRALVSSARHLSGFPVALQLLTYLRTSQGDPRSDEIFRELLEASPVVRQLIQSLFVLAFLPMIHRTVRQIAKIHPTLSFEDASQQLLSSFLQFLRSDELRKRKSHLAFSIARTLKRSAFAWAKREGGPPVGRQDNLAEYFVAQPLEESFERQFMLRHFLHRCVTKGLLDSDELDLLIQFKLDGNTGEDLGSAAGLSANALRQRAKRLLAKLRRLAQTPGIAA